MTERYPERKKEFYTDSGIPVERFYTPEDLKDWDYLEKLGFPGDYHFYSWRSTHNVQRDVFGLCGNMQASMTAKETNERFRVPTGSKDRPLLVASGFGLRKWGMTLTSSASRGRSGGGCSHRFS